MGVFRRRSLVLLLPILLGSSACGAPTAPQEAGPEPSGTDPQAAVAASLPPLCADAAVPGTGALVRACVPAVGWNGDVVVWAHGYVSPLEPIALPDDEIGGFSLDEIAGALGYGYATTSYRRNGLAADVAVEDLDDALAFFGDVFGGAGRAYLVGASEGGLATALSLDRPGTPWDGGLVACAPAGDFAAQVDYFGDFRVLFDVWYRGLVDDDADPSTPWRPWGAGGDVSISPALQAAWPTVEATVRAVVLADLARARTLLTVARVPFDPADPTTVVDSVIELLWYNVFASNDGVQLFGGVPYDNTVRIYRGSVNDLLLNLVVQRIAADPAARAGLSSMETEGTASVPVVVLHTTGDPVIPVSQGAVYRQELLAAGTAPSVDAFPVFRHGHCDFTPAEIVTAFAVLVYRTHGAALLADAPTFEGEIGADRFRSLAEAQATRERTERR